MKVNVGQQVKKNYRNQRLSVLISVKAWSKPSENLRMLHLRPVSGKTKNEKTEICTVALSSILDILLRP